MKGYKDVTDDPVFLKDDEILEIVCCDCGKTEEIVFEKTRKGIKIYFTRLYPETVKNRGQSTLANCGEGGWILKKR